MPNLFLHRNVYDLCTLYILVGEVVALVGPSGGGKTTIIKLLERFYLPTSGAVLIDGRDIGMYDPKWLRRHVALVSQEPVLFARSIKKNIMYGLETEDGQEPPTQVRRHLWHFDQGRGSVACTVEPDFRCLAAIWTGFL